MVLRRLVEELDRAAPRLVVHVEVTSELPQLPDVLLLHNADEPHQHAVVAARLKVGGATVNERGHQLDAGRHRLQGILLLDAVSADTGVVRGVTRLGVAVVPREAEPVDVAASASGEGNGRLLQLVA